MQQPISFDMLLSVPVDGIADHGARAYVDGQRVSMADFNDISRGHHVRLDCFSSSTSANGKRRLYRKVATI